MRLKTVHISNRTKLFWKRVPEPWRCCHKSKKNHVRRLNSLSGIRIFTIPEIVLLISLALSVRNVFIKERANETDCDDDGSFDDSNKIVISGDRVI